MVLSCEILEDEVLPLMASNGYFSNLMREILSSDIWTHVYIALFLGGHKPKMLGTTDPNYIKIVTSPNLI